MSANPQPPTRLIAHFSTRDRQSLSSGWAELWDTNQNDLWDRGMPSPALVDWIEARPDVLSSPSSSSGAARRLTALVPGCGKGYDVVMLALHGFNVYGLEVSRRAVQTAEAYAEAQLASPCSRNFGDGGPPGDSVGSVKFLEGDFFQRDWEAGINATPDGGVFQGFDLIYDYTFLCALPPELRKDWARRMSELLSPTGVLACLEFPLYKDLRAPGPPWGLKGVYWDILAEGGDGIVGDGEPSAVGAGGRLLLQGGGKGKMERVAYFKPPRTYDIGKDTDMFSVWRLK
ncbi:hypothetical protein AAE478_004941 [Parahypoxylon ruwenzoriense]